MNFPNRIKSISFLKTHAAEVIRNLAAQAEPLVITQNGEAKAILQDINSYQETQETMALLKILALGQHQIDQRNFKPAADVVAEVRARSKTRE